jgi:hypothetical protein
MLKLSNENAAYIWLRMGQRYGHKWASQCGDNPFGPDAVEWRDTLAGMTRAQIERGFAADTKRAEAWPPSSTEFRALCLDIPSKFSVQQEIDAQAQAISRNAERPRMTPFARLAAQLIDWHNYRQASDRDCDAMFKRAYDGAREHVLNGGDLPPEPVALIGSDATNAPKPRRLKRWEMPLPTNDAEALERFRIMDEDARASAVADGHMTYAAAMLGSPIPAFLQRRQDIRDACAAMGVGPMDFIEHEIRTKEGRDMIAESLRHIAVTNMGIDPPNIRDE